MDREKMKKLLLINKPSLLPSQQILLQKIMKPPTFSLISLILIKMIYDLIAAFGMFYFLFCYYEVLESYQDKRSWWNGWSGIHDALLTGMLVIDAVFAYMTVNHAAKKIRFTHRVRLIFAMYQTVKMSIWWITISSLCHTLLLTIAYMMDPTVPNIWVILMTFLMPCLMGIFWYWIDLFVMRTARRNYYLFERTILNLFWSAKCICQIKNKDEKKKILDSVAQNGDTKVDIDTWESAQKASTTNKNNGLPTYAEVEKKGRAKICTCHVSTNENSDTEDTTTPPPYPYGEITLKKEEATKIVIKQEDEAGLVAITVTLSSNPTSEN